MKSGTKFWLKFSAKILAAAALAALCLYNNLRDTEACVKRDAIQAYTAHAEETELININTAGSRELQRLNGIGRVKARAIIDYRDENGSFATVDELINVKGIGEKTLEKIRGNITV